jgi:small subunit ribosomal protein S16
MVVIRLTRAGAKNRPYFRVVAADSRRQRDGRFLEILGHYNPLSQPFELVIHKDKVEAWLARGAQPSEQAASLLKHVGIPLGKPKAPKAKSAEVTAARPKKRAKAAQ